MKKLFALLLACNLLISLMACAPDQTSAQSSASSVPGTSAAQEAPAASEVPVESTTQATVPTESAAQTTWQEDYSYSLAQQAFVYCYPLLKRNAAVQRGNDFGTYKYVDEIWGPEIKAGASMNVDTLYATAYIDITEEPAVFTIPENTDGRYYSIQFFEAYSDGIGYLGTRMSENKASACLITPPGWQGSVPAGIDQVIESPTNWVTAGGRTFTTNTSEDLAKAVDLHRQYQVYPLSQWGKQNPEPYPTVSGKELTLPPVEVTDPAGTIEIINHCIQKVGYPLRDEALMRQYGQIGIGPFANKAFAELDPASQAAIGRAFVDGMEILKKGAVDVGSIYDLNQTVNGWRYNPSNWGRMAENGDFIGRAATQAYSGSGENYIEECVKLRVFEDENGEMLNGSNQYKIHFPKEQIPQSDAFWSLTVYDSSYNLFANAANKYAVRDIDPDLKLAADGSLTIHLQSEEPDDQSVNWIPTIADEDFNIFFRNYLPAQNFIDQSYIPPAVIKTVK